MTPKSEALAILRHIDRSASDALDRKVRIERLVRFFRHWAEAAPDEPDSEYNRLTIIANVLEGAL